MFLSLSANRIILSFGLSQKLKIIRFADKDGTLLYFDFIVKETGESMVVSEDELIRSINENALRRRAAEMDTLFLPELYSTTPSDPTVEAMSAPAGVIHLGDRVKARHEYGGSREGFVVEFQQSDLTPRVKLRYLDKTFGWVSSSSVLVLYTHIPETSKNKKVYHGKG